MLFMLVMSENGQYINDINDEISFLAIPITQAQLFKYSFAKIGNCIDTTDIITIANHDKNCRKKEEVGNNGKMCSLVTTTVT